MRALFIIYRSLLLGCISNLREIGQLRLDLLHFKDIMIQINVLSSTYQFLKQSDSYLWGKTGGPCHVDAIAVVLALEVAQFSLNNVHKRGLKHHHF